MLLRNAKRSTKGKLKLKAKLLEVYQDYLDDIDFLMWLANLLATTSMFLSLVLACKD